MICESRPKFLLGEKIWIITEAADESGHRAATTILLPSEQIAAAVRNTPTI